MIRASIPKDLKQDSQNRLRLHIPMILLRNDFRIGLVISPRAAVLAFGFASGKYSYTRTNN